jgi:hypothetical protein
MTNQHLTNEQFTEVLSGDCALDASRHMQTCPQCRQELDQVQAGIGSFVTLGLEWAEKRAPALPLARSSFVRRWQPVDTWAAAAVLAIGILFGVHQERILQTPAVMAVPSPESADSASEVSDDNRLMMAIDQEIHWQAESPVSVATSARHPHSPSPRRLAD